MSTSSQFGYTTCNFVAKYCWHIFWIAKLGSQFSQLVKKISHCLTQNDISVKLHPCNTVCMTCFCRGMAHLCRLPSIPGLPVPARSPPYWPGRSSGGTTLQRVLPRPTLCCHGDRAQRGNHHVRYPVNGWGRERVLQCIVQCVQTEACGKDHHYWNKTKMGQIPSKLLNRMARSTTV
jgi:hypothetical protein